MNITICFTENDFREGEVLTDVLQRTFGTTTPPAFVVSGGFVPPVEGGPNYDLTTHTSDDEPLDPGFLPGGDKHLADDDAAPPSPSNTVPSGELDANGVPWSAELHSSGKTKMASGPRKGWWVKKKGMDEQEFLQRTADLKSRFSANAPILPAGDGPGADDDGVVLAGGPAAPAAAAPAAQTAAGLPPLAPLPLDQVTVPVFLQRVGELKNRGALTQARIDAVLAMYEVPSVPMLASPKYKEMMGSIAVELGVASS